MEDEEEIFEIPGQWTHAHRQTIATFLLQGGF